MNNEKRAGILDKLLSNGGDATVKLVTLALVIVTGGGNLWATKDAGRLNHEETERAIRELHDLHGALDDFEKRQKEELDYTQELLKNQTSMLENQHQMLAALRKSEH